MIMYSGILFLALSFAIVLFSNTHLQKEKKKVGALEHRIICAAAVAAGCVIRFYAMGSLPSGLNAEEALSAVQAKAIWQTGGFLFDGKLTAQLQQWTGEAGGPFLALFAAPFVGVMGMTMTAVRLPLTLLSCAAMFAAYGIGKEISGERAARWMLVIYALCPTFILNARFAASANTAVFLMPIAFYVLILGLRKRHWLYAGMMLLGLLAYTYDVYIFIVPIVILATVFAAKASGIEVKHCAAAGSLGLLFCLPALLVLWVNLSGADGFVLFDWIVIPELEGFGKSDFVWTGCQGIVQVIEAIRDQAFAVAFGALFQVMRHENIAEAMFVPGGILAFYTMSIPIAFLGILAFLNDGTKKLRDGSGVGVKRTFLAVSGTAVFVVLVLVGSKGFLDYSGGTSVFDYSALHMFFALLMTVGLCRIEEKSTVGRVCVIGLLSVSVAVFCVFLFGGTYKDGANAHFTGLEDAYKRAAQLQEEKECAVYMTTTVYPHMDPAGASEIMYLYASDADMRTAAQNRGYAYHAVYLSGVESLDADAIYVAKVDDLYNCNYENWQYEEFGEYAVLFQEY